jgi:pyruvate dehydrogenase E2 component (dihydrolipoamide acetyltransferase)
MPFLSIPNLGDDIATATLTDWLKTAGNSFLAGEELAEFETENGRLILEAAAAGHLTETLVQPGQTVRAGETLARVEGATAPSEQEGKLDPTEHVMSDGSTSSGAGKVVPILMPQAGNTMEEGTVLSWRVKEGDHIAAGQVICEIETDKATVDYESPEAGRLARIVVAPGVPVAVKEIIALLADSDVEADAYLADQGKSPTLSDSLAAGVATPSPANGKSVSQFTTAAGITAEGRVKASPAARKLAAELGVMLTAVRIGSGPGGRILSTDLSHADPARSVAAAIGVVEIRRPLSKMRRAIGLNLQQSKQTVPHFYVRTTIDADSLLAFYREQKEQAHCTLNDVIVLAVGRAICDFPAVRSQIMGNEIIEYPHANIGIAVGVDDGLVVPVVLSVDTLSLSGLAVETKRIVDNARKGRLENIGKGHFTISNLGMFGVEEFSAIINPPESGILAVSAVREAVVVKNGAMRVGHQMTMTVSADHRVVDGVMAAKFMQTLQAILEHPADVLA